MSEFQGRSSGNELCRCAIPKIWVSKEQIKKMCPPEPNKWISVEDSYPESGAEVLVYLPKYDYRGNDIITVATIEHEPTPQNNLWFFIPSGYSVDGNITHWMELPPKPEIK